MIKKLVPLVLVFATLSLIRVAASPQKSPGAGPIVVLETVRGNIEFETYPEEAPKTVGRVLELVKKNFYNGLRFHRAACQRDEDRFTGHGLDRGD